MHRHSRQRDAVYEALSSVRTHPTAVEVYDLVRAEIPNVSLATVYRNLKMLVEDNKAIMIPSDDAVEHYDAFVVPHNHMVCEQCHRVFDLGGEVMDPDVPEQTPHKITSVRVLYHGTCSHCLSAE